jgi:hypothetical protein
MNEIIRILKSPEECQQLEKIFTDLARQARRRAVELRAIAYGYESAVEKELLEVLYAYEEVLSKKNNRRTHASRTWQMVNRYGIIEAATRAVNRPAEAMGYKLLIEMGLHDLTFEAVIVRYPEAFSKEIVNLARKRLEELKNI